MICETCSYTKEEVELYHKIYDQKRAEVISGEFIPESFQMTKSVEEKLSPYYDPTSDYYSLLEQGNVLKNNFRYDAFLRGKYGIMKAYL
jgi:hypothetical protein